MENTNESLSASLDTVQNADKEAESMNKTATENEGKASNMSAATSLEEAGSHPVSSTGPGKEEEPVSETAPLIPSEPQSSQTQSVTSSLSGPTVQTSETQEKPSAEPVTEGSVSSSVQNYQSEAPAVAPQTSTTEILQPKAPNPSTTPAECVSSVDTVAKNDPTTETESEIPDTGREISPPTPTTSVPDIAKEKVPGLSSSQVKKPERESEDVGSSGENMKNVAPVSSGTESVSSTCPNKMGAVLTESGEKDNSSEGKTEPKVDKVAEHVARSETSMEVSAVPSSEVKKDSKDKETLSPTKDVKPKLDSAVSTPEKKYCACEDENSEEPKASDSESVPTEGKVVEANADSVVDGSTDGTSNVETKQSDGLSYSPPVTSSNSLEEKSGSEKPVEDKQEESMEVDGAPIEKQVPVFLCDENSKDQPPQNFKPFSHYNKEGKLIDEDGAGSLQFRMKSPVTIEDNSFPESDAASNSVPTSSDPASRVNTPSKFQGQFMDFLKCTDDATEHSIIDQDGGQKAGTGEAANIQIDETSQTPSEKSRKGKGKRRKGGDESSQSATSEKKQPKKKKGKEAEKGPEEVKIEETTKGEATTDNNSFRPESLFEYQWPQDDKNAEWFFLQEQVSPYLQVKSFKRRYPELVRRTVGIAERNFLAENGIVSEMQCDLGLMALKSDQVYNLMSKEFPEKYQAYAEVLHARERERVSEKSKAQAELAKMDKSHINDLVKKAVKSAADFNAQFMREKREERRAYFDLQTYEIHYPLGSIKKLPSEATKPSSYPVALIPGQYQDYFKRYTSQQLRYFPVNTATYDPPRHLKTIYADPSDKYESELDSQSASSQGDAQDASSSSGSSSGSSSESDSENSEVEEVVEPPPAPPVTTKKNARTPRSKKTNATKADANAVCNNCQGNAEANKIGEAEELVKCSECGRHGHPSCLELTEEMIPNIKTYPWQCMECKTCVECMDPYDEDKMMFCDHCDRGYHTFCVGLRSIPTGRWECPSCRPEPPTKRRRR